MIRFQKTVRNLSGSVCTARSARAPSTESSFRHGDFQLTCSSGIVVARASDRFNRTPLSEKGKPAARLGRKAAGQAGRLTAGLPKKERRGGGPPPPPARGRSREEG